MSAEILRRAASLMRERAKREDSRWIASVNGRGQPGGGRHAAHMASWHPAVADWLDRVAEDAECDNYEPDEYESACDIARAYLGESA